MTNRRDASKHLVMGNLHIPLAPMRDSRARFEVDSGGKN